MYNEKEMWIPRRPSKLLCWVAMCAVFTMSSVHGYKSGDAIDTIIWSHSTARDATRAQMPSFGMATKVDFVQKRGRFSLGFQEGYHTLPYIESRNLEKLFVTFVYSRSGQGVIHSVSSTPTYVEEGGKSGEKIIVEYNWVEEEPVDIRSGATVMFLATLVASLIFMLQACGLSDDDEEEDDDYNPTPYGVSDRDVPKWGHRD